MGFFPSNKKASSKTNQSMNLSVDMLHRLGCRVCPLDKITANHNPHIEPIGSDNPLIYVLGEKPGKKEDEEGAPLTGNAHAWLMDRIPHEYHRDLRWNNTVRTRTMADANPMPEAIEACRPSVIKDIVETKPKAIFGLGSYALHWVCGQHGVEKWRGRRLPVNVGGHVCWYYPMMHPRQLLKIRKLDYRGNKRPTELERAAEFDLKRALDHVDLDEVPRVYTEKELRDNVELIECTDAGLARLEHLIDWACNLKEAGVDYETWRTRPYYDDAIILSAAIGTEEKSFAFAIDHPQARWNSKQLGLIRKLWKKFLKSPCRKWVHNLTFEMEWTAVQFGREFLRNTPWEDSYNQAAVLDERFGDSKPGCLSLEFLMLQWFGINIKNLSPLDRKDLRGEPLADVLRYNAIDAKAHFMLGRMQRKALKAEDLQSVYRGDLKKIPTLVLSQFKGIPVYVPENKLLQEKYRARIKEAEDKISGMKVVRRYKEKYGEDFNPASNKQMGVLLDKFLGFKEVMQENGKYKVDEDAMMLIDHPIIKWEMKRRKAAKLLGTYIEKLDPDHKETFVFPDGKIHPQYKQPGTETDRTAAADPNVQNQHKRNAEAKEVRKQFRAPKNHWYASVDFGQIQFRGVGMLTKDKEIVSYLWDDRDIHKDWTNELAYAYPQRVGGKEFLKSWEPGGAMKTFRNDVKNQWTFPCIFGASVKSRAEYLKMPEHIIKKADEKFWKTYYGIADWHERLLKRYQQEGIVEHINGRINRAPLSRNQLFNYPVQGIEAQIVVEWAMVELSRHAQRIGDWYFQPELEIHDDLSFILPKSEELVKAHAAAKKKDHKEAAYWTNKDQYVGEIVKIMLSCPYKFINVPLTIEAAVGKDLYAMDEIAVFNSKDF